MDLAFLGRVSTEDAQDPTASRAWQIDRASGLITPLGHRITAEYFDIGQSRSIPWARRPEASRLLTALKDPNLPGRAMAHGRASSALVRRGSGSLERGTPCPSCSALT